MTGESVVLIGASRLFREGLRRIFSDSSFSVVHESFSIEDALPFIASLQPSLVLVDPPDEFEALTERIRQIRAAAPGGRVVVLTESIRGNQLADALAAGIDGYLLKNMSADALHQSLRLILLGEKVLPTELAALLTNGRPLLWNDVGLQSHFNGLSDLEMQILRCLLSGAQNKQIADELKISNCAVKVHVAVILKKICVQNRTQARLSGR
jgi:two-component system, NarL family, nitrate/nitrite response regulator NarL